MRIETYDCEVFLYDWIVVFKDFQSGLYTVIHNDNDGLQAAINDDCMYVGFNSKHYDQYIIKGICCGLVPEEVKQVNDWIIIDDNQGWECPLLDGKFFRFNNVDIRDDVRLGISLKDIEGHLGMNIEETQVDFDIDRPLTQDELEMTIEYCMHDVDATEEVIKLRSSYLRTKRNLGARAGLDEYTALSCTNAKLTAKMLKAQRREWTDGRDYVYPDNLDRSVIPAEILNFFDTIHDKTVPDDVLFKTSLDITLGDMPCKYAWGGVHGSQRAYHEKATEDRVIQNRDVSSLYPSLIEGYHYLSRNVPDPELFYQIRKDRIEAKHTGNKQLAKDLKLPLNTVSGAQENKYNDLYDPLPTRSMRISGQLFLTVLTMRLLKTCKSIKLLNLNTDGLAYSIDKTELPQVDRICAEWEQETGFELELDEIEELWIKDVNNLFIKKTSGETKAVGGYLSYGISEKGAWAINNSGVIYKKALINYFADGTPIEDTINNSQDILDFQFIAKAGSKYSGAYHMVYGKKIPVQKVNRVYATADEYYGTLYKVKKETGGVAKIENLPDHCIVDNRNALTIDDIDKSYYIRLTQDKLNDYLGIGRRKTMATAKAKSEEKMNVYQKLLRARELFLAGGATKSGKNATIRYQYFELDDIVPVVTRVFSEVGLIALVSYSEVNATMTVVNVDAPEEKIVFVSPMRLPVENKAVNPVQAMGSAHTYFRRYLYMAALDICEPDGIEQTTVPDKEDKPKAKIPVPTEERKTIKQELTDTDGPATELQIKALKKVLAQLKAQDPSKEKDIAELAVKTSGFKKLTKTQCNELMSKMKGLIA